MILYVNGCSLTRGSCDGYNESKELQNSISFSSQLKNTFDKIINEATSCSSNFNILNNTIKFINDNYHIKDNLFVWICWSDPNRFEIFTNDDIEVEILKKYPWGGKEFIYGGCKLNITNFWTNRFLNEIKDYYSLEAKELSNKLPNLNNTIDYLLINQSLDRNYDLFLNQIILLQTFLKANNVKYGMSFAIDFYKQNKIINNKLLDCFTIYEPLSSMFSILLKNKFKNDPTMHFYPDGYEFYGQQIAKFIREKYDIIC
jgi:hypothetical protein